MEKLNRLFKTQKILLKKDSKTKYFNILLEKYLKNYIKTSVTHQVKKTWYASSKKFYSALNAICFVRHTLAYFFYLDSNVSRVEELL